MKDVWIIGDADGPTAIYITGRKGQKPSVFLKTISMVSLAFLGIGLLLRFLPCLFAKRR